MVSSRLTHPHTHTHITHNSPLLAIHTPHIFHNFFAHTRIGPINTAGLHKLLQAELPTTSDHSPPPHTDLSQLPPSQQQQQHTSTSPLNKHQRDTWCHQNLPTAVQLACDNQNGKNNIKQSFYSDVCFRHIVPHLHSSGLLTLGMRKTLGKAFPLYRRYLALLRTHRHIDISNLRHRAPPPAPSHRFMQETAAQVTAAILHYKCDVAAAVRFIGGQHIAQHLQTNTIIPTLRTAGVPEPILDDLQRIIRFGAPAKAQVTSTEQNFREFLARGNHRSIYQNPTQTKQAFEKDIRRGYALAANPWLILFTPHTHRTPVGMICTDHRYKKPRNIFDSSFRPHPWSLAINDMLDPASEPPIHFQHSFKIFLTWIWNLRISYPHREIYLGDDDVSGAFRRVKLNPNLVAMHSCMLFGYLFFMTGQTFGGNTSPANWEPVAMARMHYARYLWAQDDTPSKGQQLLPTLRFTPPPTTDITDSFPIPTIEPSHTGVFTPEGKRQPPPYTHHVDDCYYADVRECFLRTASASILALYLLLGRPSETNPDAFAWDKFDGYLSYERKAKGWLVNSRTLQVTLPPYKREIVLTELQRTLSSTHATLKSLAELLGLLSDLSTICRWARPRYFHLQHTLATFLRQRAHQIRAYLDRTGKRTEFAHYLHASLPKHLAHRIAPLLAQHDALLLWAYKGKLKLNKHALQQLEWFFTYLKDPANVWGCSIGHLIDRQPFATTTGDASHLGLGGYSPELQFWFAVIFSPRIRARADLHPTHPDYLHINQLEFAVVLLQTAATLVRLQAPPPANLQTTYPNGYPYAPILLNRTDNTPTNNWTNKVATRSPRAYPLVAFLANLLQQSQHLLDLRSTHIKGCHNHLADTLSRPLSSDTHSHTQQIYQTSPATTSWNFFRPSPALLSTISQLLSSPANRDLPKPPSNLGHFEPAGSTTLCSWLA